jgi:hypothetical protein
MKNIIWLSPSLVAGAIAARLVAFFERRPQTSPRRGVKLQPPPATNVCHPKTPEQLLLLCDEG